MMKQIQAFRAKLDSGQFCVGCGITFSDPAVTECLCESADFMWIDLEHTPLGLESVLGHLIAAHGGGVPALVRVPVSDPMWIKRVLDTGADGVIVPQIRSAEEVQRCVSACRYPPEATRGFGPRRGARYGRSKSSEYREEANRGVFCVAQIETVEAVEQLDAILAIDGLDSLVVGPYDLSGSMGMMGEVTHPKVLEVIQTIVNKAKEAGVYVGMGMDADQEYAVQAAKMGIQWVQFGGDFTYMVRFVDDRFSATREAVSR